MVLLYCTIAYFAGLILGRLAWQDGWIRCEFPDWLWLLPIALLPFTPLLVRFEQRSSAAMRWPESAGFKPIRTGPSYALIGALLLCVVSGVARYGSQPLTPCWTPDDLAYYNLASDRAFDRDAPQVVVTGVVCNYPSVADTKQRLHVAVSSVQTDEVDQAVTGTLRLTTGNGRRYMYGQRLRLHGRLVTPPDFEDFSYRAFLARKGVHSLMYGARIDVVAGQNAGNPVIRALYALRANGEALINRRLPEPYSALANGMLLGIEAGIPDDLYDQFNLTGTSHVIVISGSNVALIAGVMVALGTRLFGRKRAVYPALLGIACFALLVGGDAAVMRAALMGSLFVYASAIGRRSTALVSLAVACWVMTLINPLTLWDVGFQLSSAATAGLILFSPTITASFDNLLNRLRTLRPQSPFPAHQSPMSLRDHFVSTSLPTSTLRSLIEDGLLITIAANITTLPLVIFYFGRLSFVSLVTNLLIAPVQPFIMLWGSAGILIGVVGLPWLAQAILWVPWLSLVWTVAMVEWTAGLPGASVEIAEYGMGALSMTHLFIFGIHWRRPLVAGWHRLRNWDGSAFRSKLLAPALAGILAVLCVIVWRLALTQPDGRLHVHFLDIGQGDGILIQTPSGRQVLVDGGKSPQMLFNELGEVLPFWDRSIDMLLLTHPDGDHMIGQIDVPVRFQVEHALDTAVSQANPDAQPWRTSMARAGAVVHILHEGAWVDLGDGVALWILWPPSDGFQHEHAENENSLVAKVVYGDFSLLLTGDSGVPSEAIWMRNDEPIASTVLKVGHHGSNSATSPEFVQAVNPSVAVIQVGADNDYGHPTMEVLATLAGRRVLRNDRDGRIHVASDGQWMWIDAEKEGNQN